MQQTGKGASPQISYPCNAVAAAAFFQIPWFAKARGLPEDQLRSLVEENTAGRLLGILGEPHGNVLKLNLALDALAKKS
jgi:K+-transporting ATPase ATPase C chain